MKDNLSRVVDEILNEIWWHGASYGTGLLRTEDGTKDENIRTATRDLATLISNEKIASYKKGYIDGGIGAINER